MVDPDRTTEQLRAEVLIALRRIIHAVEMHSRELDCQWGVTGPQLVVLKCLEASPESSMSVGDLARAVQLSQTTVTGILNRLAARDLVERVRSDRDKRRVELTLTDAGRKIARAAPSWVRQQFVDRFAKLERWEQMMLASVMKRIDQMIQTPDLAPPALDPAAQAPALDPALAALAMTTQADADQYRGSVSPVNDPTPSPASPDVSPDIDTPQSPSTNAPRPPDADNP